MPSPKHQSVYSGAGDVWRGVRRSIAEFSGATTTELDERRGIAPSADHRICVFAEDLVLGAGEIIFGKTANLLKSAEPTAS